MYKLIGTNIYVGSSIEEKPTNAKPGDSFIEIDNCVVYIYNGSSWSVKCIKSHTEDEINILLGKMFVSSNVYDSLSFGEKIVARFKTPTIESGKFAYIKYLNVSAQGATLKITMKRNVTILTPGIFTDSLVNLNNNSSNTAQSKVYGSIGEDVVTYSGGTQIIVYAIHGSTTPTSFVGGTTPLIGITQQVTKPGEENIIEIENVDPIEDTAYRIGIIDYVLEDDIGTLGS